MIKLARGQPINLHSYMKYVVLRRLRRRTGAKCLIETGTFLGVTAARCARVFERVFTIELDVRLATNAQAYLRRFPNVEAFKGDAIELLPQIIARDDAREAVVFLDAHNSGGDTAQRAGPEPAVLELEILGRYADRICAVETNPGFQFPDEGSIGHLCGIRLHHLIEYPIHRAALGEQQELHAVSRTGALE